MLKINFFNKEYGVLKSQNYERISLELLNKSYHITENDFKNKDYCLDKFNSKDTFIGDIAHTEKELISLIEDNIKNPKNMKHQNLSSIFDYTDHHNNQRVYHSILDLIQDNTSS